MKDETKLEVLPNDVLGIMTRLAGQICTHCQGQVGQVDYDATITHIDHLRAFAVHYRNQAIKIQADYEASATNKQNALRQQPLPNGEARPS